MCIVSLKKLPKLMSLRGITDVLCRLCDLSEAAQSPTNALMETAPAQRAGFTDKVQLAATSQEFLQVRRLRSTVELLAATCESFSCNEER
jgi:hypothetical protein